MNFDPGPYYPTYTYSSPSFITTTSTTSGTLINGALTWHNSPGYTSPPPPREPTALEWLSSEIEKTCKLAR